VQVANTVFEHKVRIGIMFFDSADADLLIQDGQWEATILHEMGHVLGL